MFLLKLSGKKKSSQIEIYADQCILEYVKKGDTTTFISALNLLIKEILKYN